MSNSVSLYRRLATPSVLALCAMIYDGSALADTKEITCSSQWCKIMCNTVNAEVRCEGHGGTLASCTCRGEKMGASTHVKCTTGETCDKECEAGTRPGGNCNMGKPQCVCTDVQ
jgi:hypothetical protein